MAAEKKFVPNVIAFACNWGGYPLLKDVDFASSSDIHLVRLMCGGRVSAGLLLRAFELGADGVAVFGCDEKECHYSFGAAKGKEELYLTRRMGHLLGIEDERLTYCGVHPGDMEKTRQDMKKFLEGIKKLGRSTITLG